jgi:hypothetical protein
MSDAMELEKCLPRSSDPISDSNDYSPHEGSIVLGLSSIY